MSLLRCSIFSFVSREFVIDFWNILRRLLSNPCRMIPASDRLSVWHQLNVFAHLNGNCFGSCCDGYFFFYFFIASWSVVYSVRAVWAYLNLSFQQPVLLLGLAHGFLACSCGLWSPWHGVVRALWCCFGLLGVSGVGAAVAPSLFCRHPRACQGLPTPLVEGWAAFSLCPHMALPLCAHSGISSSSGKDTNPIGWGPHPSDLI